MALEFTITSPASEGLSPVTADAPTGIEKNKAENPEQKPNPESKPAEQVLAKWLKDLMNPAVLQKEVDAVFTNKPELFEQYNRAIESGDKRQQAQVMGRIMEDVITNRLSKICNESGQQIACVDKDGNARRTDYEGTANIEISFPGGYENVKPGEKISIEVKTGKESYLLGQFKDGGHAEKQVQAHDGKSVVIVSCDFKNLPPEKQAEIRNRFAAQGSIIISTLPKTNVIESAVNRAYESKMCSGD